MGNSRRVAGLLGAWFLWMGSCANNDRAPLAGPTPSNKDDDADSAAGAAHDAASAGGTGAGGTRLSRAGSTGKAGGDAVGAGGDASSGGEGPGLRPGEPCAAPYPTGFCFISEPDEFIGEGRTGVMSGDVGEVLVKGAPWLIFYAGQTGVGDFYGELSAKLGDYFLPGNYSPASEHPLPGAARLTVSGNSHGCDSEGEFTVRELGRDPYGTFNRVSASFVQHCSYAKNKLYGVIHVNATGVDDPVPENPDDCEVSSPLGLCYVSQEGHEVGRSQIVSVDGTNAAFSVGHSFDGPEVTVSKLNFSPIWRQYFGGPNHARLSVGHYDGAADDVPNSPIMNACKGLVGSFDVLAAEYSEPADALPSQTDILRLDVDFHYACANSDAKLHGKLRFTKPE